MFTSFLTLAFLFLWISPGVFAMEGAEFLTGKVVGLSGGMTGLPPPIKIPRDVSSDTGIPIAVVVSMGSPVVRASSITAALTDSQPWVDSQGEELVVMSHADEEKRSTPCYGIRMTVCDDLIVRSLFERVLDVTQQAVLKNMADRGICTARLAIRILHKPEMNFDMTEDEVSKSFNEAFSVFSSYQTTNLSVYQYWILQLSNHGFLSAEK
ncbi:MAG: hypothetical protein K2W94_00505 [Alphaproteobacteria bacterium]|nr:hypothetical protein [Alphaproteobacteria bacterium]